MDFQQSFRETCDRASSQLAFFASNIGNTTPGATDSLKNVLEKAAEFQGIVGQRGRLHIMYEAAPPSYDKSHDFVYSPFVQNLVCVLFSQSLIFQGEKRVNASTQLMAAVNAFSLLLPDRSPPPSTVNQPNPPDQTDHHLQQTAPPPPWYPGKRYQSGPQVSDEPLQVSERAFALFKPFDMTYIHKIYRSLFTRMHARIKASKNGNLQGSVVYERFTPPWIRKKIIFGDKGVTFGEAILPDIHRMRNNAGTRRLKLILAAFYEREILARNILDEILPAFVQRRREERLLHENPAIRHPSNSNSTPKQPQRTSIPSASTGLLPSKNTVAEGAKINSLAFHNKGRLSKSPVKAIQPSSSSSPDLTSPVNPTVPQQFPVTVQQPARVRNGVVYPVTNDIPVRIVSPSTVAPLIAAPSYTAKAPTMKQSLRRPSIKSQMMFNVGKHVAMVHASQSTAAMAAMAAATPPIRGPVSRNLNNSTASSLIGQGQMQSQVQRLANSLVLPQGVVNEGEVVSAPISDDATNCNGTSMDEPGMIASTSLTTLDNVNASLLEMRGIKRRRSPSSEEVKGQGSPSRKPRVSEIESIIVADGAESNEKTEDSAAVDARGQPMVDNNIEADDVVGCIEHETIPQPTPPKQNGGCVTGENQAVSVNLAIDKSNEDVPNEEAEPRGADITEEGTSTGEEAHAAEDGANR